MKYLLAFFAALVVVGVSAVPFNGNRTDLFNGNKSYISRESFLDVFNGNYTVYLETDLAEFIYLIPLDKLGELMEKYKHDQQIISGVNYLYHHHFHDWLSIVETLPEYHELVNYFQESGLNIIRYMKVFHLIFRMKDYIPPPTSSHEVFKREANSQGGFEGFFDEFIAMLPINEIKELHQKKVKESETFSKFSSYMHNKKLPEMCNDLANNEKVQVLLKYLKLSGIDHLMALNTILYIFGFRP